MEVVKRGHIYRLDVIKPYSSWPNETYQDHLDFWFVNKEPGQERPGTTTQETVRMLIDRTHYCNNCLPHRVNEQIIWHFRQVIALHEARALEMKAHKGELLPEFVPLGADGHFKLMPSRALTVLEETVLKPVEPLGKTHCDHRSAG